MPGLSLSLLVFLATISACLGRTKNVTKGHSKELQCPPNLSRGWADEVNWVQTYEEALYKIRKSNRPLMVIHHLEECPFSQSLKKAFASDHEIQKMAKEDFVMINLIFETTDENLYPDGQYVPRIIFVDPSLTVRADIKGRYKNRAYAYEDTDIELCKASVIGNHVAAEFKCGHWIVEGDYKEQPKSSMTHCGAPCAASFSEYILPCNLSHNFPHIFRRISRPLIFEGFKTRLICQNNGNPKLTYPITLERK